MRKWVALCVLVWALASAGAPARAADAPATQPTKVLEGVEAAMKMVPAGVLPAKPEDWTVAKRDVANAAFDEKVKGQRVRLRVKVSGVGKEGEDYVLIAEPVQTPIYNASIDIYVSKENALDVARLNVGDEVAVIGRVNLMSFGDQMPVPELACVLMNSVIVRDAPKR